MRHQTQPFLAQFSSKARRDHPPPKLRSSPANGLLYLEGAETPLIETVLAPGSGHVSRAALRQYLETTITKAQWDQIDPNAVRSTLADRYEQFSSSSATDKAFD